jgi:hypothetical protein
MDDVIIDEAGEPGIQLRDARGCLMKGHPRIPGSGRPLGKKNWSVRALAEQLGVNPFLISLGILKTQHLPATEPGKKGRLVTTTEYIKVLTEVQTYLAPKITATQLTGENGGPVALATCDVTQLMQDPAMAEAAQLIALGIAAQTPQIARSPDAYDDHDLPGNGVRR